MFAPSKIPAWRSGSGRASWRVVGDGGDYASMTNAVSAGAFSPDTGDFTVAAFAMISSGTATAGVCGKRGTSGVGWSFVLRHTTNNGCYLRIGYASTFVDVAPATNQTPTIYDGKYHHIQFAISRSTGHGYTLVDGVEVGDTDISAVSGSLNNTQVASLAAIDSAFNNKITGGIAQLRLGIGTASRDASHRLRSYSDASWITWGTEFEPGQGTTITPYVGTPPFTIAAAPADLAFGDAYLSVEGGLI